MPPIELREWMEHNELTHEQAASYLRMSVSGFRKNLYGITPIGAQTERIIELGDLVQRTWGLLTRVRDDKRRELNQD